MGAFADVQFNNNLNVIKDIRRLIINSYSKG